MPYCEILNIARSWGIKKSCDEECRKGEFDFPVMCPILEELWLAPKEEAPKFSKGQEIRQDLHNKPRF